MRWGCERSLLHELAQPLERGELGRHRRCFAARSAALCSISSRRQLVAVLGEEAAGGPGVPLPVDLEAVCAATMRTTWWRTRVG